MIYLRIEKSKNSKIMSTSKFYLLWNSNCLPSPKKKIYRPEAQFCKCDQLVQVNF